MFKKLLTMTLMISTLSFAMTEEEKNHYAKLLANPIANLQIIPFQYNYNDGIGPFESGKKSQLNIQPVLPFNLNEDWTLISRTIFPVIQQNDMYPGYGEKKGLGDITQFLFFSPKTEGYTFGFGPVFTLPTATDDAFATGKYTAGPTAVILKQQGSFTVGMLADTLWTIGGESKQEETTYASSLIQPFITKSVGNGRSFGLSSESTYNWTNNDKLIPVYLMMNQLLPINGHLFNISVGPGYYVETPDDYNSNWIFRFQFILLFPKN